MSHRTYLNTGNAGKDFSSLFVQSWGGVTITSHVTDKPEMVEFSIRDRGGNWSHSVRLDVDQVDDLIQLLSDLRNAIPTPLKKEIPQVIFRD